MPDSHSKVLWLEGMTLDPHHFQQWDRYQANQIHSRIRAIQRNDWGLTALGIDEGRLANGEFALTECQGVLSDGFQFSMPDEDPLPVPRGLSEVFDASAAQLDVFLCLPVEKHGGNYEMQGAPGSQLTRYRADSVSVADENMSAEEREIQVGVPKFQIRFGTETLEGYTSIQLASVVRNPGGLFALDSLFIPASLTLKASSRLQSLASNILELAVAKSAALDSRRLAAAAQRQLTPADITAIGLLASVNAHIPVLKNQVAGHGCHPENLYYTLLSLAGQLSAYTSVGSVHPREFPLYDHASMTSGFNQIADIVNGMLGGAQPSQNYRDLVLSRTQENLFEAQLTEDVLDRAELMLFVRSTEISEETLVSQFPAMIRIASPEMIEGVLRSYTRALPVEHTNRLPVGIPEDVTASYFNVERSGPFWDGIRESGKMAIFVPAEFENIELKLMAILRG